jgi:hypothetical protein
MARIFGFVKFLFPILMTRRERAEVVRAYDLDARQNSAVAELRRRGILIG